MSDEYRTISTTLRTLQPKSIRVDAAPSRRGTTWIARSLIHGADDRMLEGMFAGEKVTIRVMAWKAEELGFA
jgi:hypothetical protein